MTNHSYDHDLGLDSNITRRDFINVSAASVGGMLVLPKLRHSPSNQGADWYGYGGVGDYAPSHGNTPEVLRVAHSVRDGAFDGPVSDAVDTTEGYDLVIVGGGFAGMAAALRFRQERPSGRCLILENHPLFGGEAKRNEFIVDGERLMAPQGSNDFIPVPDTGGPEDYFTSLGIPREFAYQEWDQSLGKLEFPLDNYGFMHWTADKATVGHFFDGSDAGTNGSWAVDIWRNDLANTPWPQSVRGELLRARRTLVETYREDDIPRWLDSMTYKSYLEDVAGLPPQVTAYIDPILAGAIGLGCDAISAYWGQHFSLPGFSGPPDYPAVHSFPGGNGGIARFFVKSLVPDAIGGTRGIDDVITQRIAFDMLDRPDNPVRIRLDSTAVRVEHRGEVAQAERVMVTYVRNGTTYRLTARAVVMASGGWMNRRVVRDLPPEHQRAYGSFNHSAVLVANVALTNWRFLHRLGVTACMWSGGFGFSCNIRRSMVMGDYRPPLHPDRPIVMTFYVPLYYPGLRATEQGTRGRTELLQTSFREYERQIREQMVRLFGGHGFDPRTDIAGIILNRWGHAYVNPGPEFLFPQDGSTAPPDVLREPFGRIAIGHSELRGHQNWTGAAAEGRRAVEALLDTVL